VTAAPAPPPAWQTIEARGQRTRYRERGSGPACLLLHGAGGSAPWRPFQDMLARHLRVIATEHLGFGESDTPDWLDTTQALAFYYLDVLQALGVERTHVIGGSFGGWLAAELAIARPTIVDRLVLQDPIGVLKPGTTLPNMFELDAAAWNELCFYDQAIGATQATTQPTPQEMEARVHDRATMARIAEHPYFHSPSLPHRLHHILAPTLLVWGSHDRVIPVENADLWLAGIPQARLVVVPECGHSMLREKPAAFAQALVEFFEIAEGQGRGTTSGRAGGGGRGAG